MTVKLLGVAAVALSLIAAPVTARPLNQMVGFSGLNDPSITQTGVPTATINPGTYAIGGQGSVNFTPGDFKVACIVPNGTIAFVDPANPGIVCTLDPNSIVKGALTETGYIEFIPQYQNPAYGNPICLFQGDTSPTVDTLAAYAPGIASTLPGIRFIENIAAKYFLAADGKMHVGLTFQFLAVPFTPYQINFICPPKGP